MPGQSGSFSRTTKLAYLSMRLKEQNIIIQEIPCYGIAMFRLFREKIQRNVTRPESFRIQYHVLKLDIL